MDLENSEPTTVCHVVALPSPGRGHINPMMNLCKSLTSKKRNLLITFIVTEEWLDFIGSDPKPDNIRFSTVPNVIPSEIGRGVDTAGFYEEVLRKMRAPVEELLDRLEPRPITFMIADTYMNWAIEIGQQRNLPVASFWTMSALVFSVFHHFDLLLQHHHFPVDFAAFGDELVDYIPGVSSTRVADLPTCLYGKGLNVLQKALEAISWVPKAHCLLLSSVYEFEAQVIDALKENVAVPIYHVGPAIPYFKFDENPSLTGSIDAVISGTSDKIETIQRSSVSINYFEWLDLQPQGSVLYVSQGSVHSASNPQMEEIAAGLRDSGVRFFWVSRGETSRIKEACGDMGLLVPWCDQLRVLCHPSIGGFWSHCGWNSTSEAIFSGLPMLTFPIYWDQVSNSKMIVQDWKIGWTVKKELQSEILVRREEIAGLVQRFMDLESDEGKEMRRKARELQKICRQAIQKGGSTDTGINGFVSEISNCHKH